MLTEAYTNIWFCGLAASGKTTCLRWVKELLPNVTYLNDSQEIVEFIRRDVQQQHHYQPNPDAFVLTSSVPIEFAVDQLIRKAQESDQTKIIEISRGIDQHGQIDFTFQALLSVLPVQLLASSLFIYVWAPLEQRRLRNQARPRLAQQVTAFESFYCPDEAFERFFVRDDFIQTIEKYAFDHLFLANLNSQADLRRRIYHLFTTRRAE